MPSFGIIAVEERKPFMAPARPFMSPMGSTSPWLQRPSRPLDEPPHWGHKGARKEGWIEKKRKSRKNRRMKKKLAAKREAMRPIRRERRKANATRVWDPEAKKYKNIDRPVVLSELPEAINNDDEEQDDEEQDDEELRVHSIEGWTALAAAAGVVSACMVTVVAHQRRTLPMSPKPILG